MPELPEVETTRQGIHPHIQGKKVSKVLVRNPRLRWPIPNDFNNLISGKKVLATDRRGKYLLLKFSNGTAIWHLGMSGSLQIVDKSRPIEKHDHVDWVFSQKCILRFNDPRRFGCLLWHKGNKVEENKLLVNLGPEPLSEEFSVDYLYSKSRKSSKPVKAWIMDGKVVVGVGNIYANEVLFKTGIHPLKKAHRLSFNHCEKLVAEIKNILLAAIKQGGTTLRDFVNSDGKPGYFSQELSVYGKGGQGCQRCGKSLTEKVIAQRSSVYCTACQK